MKAFELVKGHPIEKMLPEINKLDSKSAAFLIAIAKKESNWGKYSPTKNGEDCYNYWGYKGSEDAQVGSYSCFKSQEEAIQKVGARIKDLLDKGFNTPEKFIVWKCGLTCRGHNKQDVRKWISDIKWSLERLDS
jgi:hypothetical protein